MHTLSLSPQRVDQNFHFMVFAHKTDFSLIKSAIFHVKTFSSTVVEKSLDYIMVQKCGRDT